MEPRDVLWSGGWDSTYRVLELALVEGVRVRPHYLIDPDRESVNLERRAIESIRATAIERGARIAEPRIQRVDAIPMSETAVEQHHSLRERFHIGPQYLWLSEYARQNGLDALELCIHRDDRANSVFEAIRSAGIPHEDESVRADESPEWLFRFFALPLAGVTKLSMRETARAQHFEDLLERTWFCHRPTRRGRPCGFCNPCLWTREEGLGDRLPLAAKLRAWLDRRVIVFLPGFRFKRNLRKWLRLAG